MVIAVGQRARKLCERPRRRRKQHGILCTDYDMTGAEDFEIQVPNNRIRTQDYKGPGREAWFMLKNEIAPR